MHGLAVAGIIWVTLDRVGLIMIMVALPSLLVGTWIGWQLYGRLNDRRFRQAIALLLIGSGATLVF
jgi:uncharacterized membrane protein YfcA